MGESTIPVVLAATHHDPEGRLYDQTARVLPQLARLFSRIAIQATHASQQRSLDLLAGAARGISRRAAAAILAGCHEQSVGTDVAWPLFLQRRAGFTIGYYATEGLEFETADRYADQVAAAGGLEAWMAQLDADPQRW